MLDGELDKKRYRTFHVRGDVGAAKTTPTPGGGEGSLEHDLDGEPVPLAGDDYRAMYEVLARRFRRGLKRQEDLKRQEEKKAGDSTPPPSSNAGAGGEAASDVGDLTHEPENEWDLPDLFVVDGGRGQLAVALAAARDLGLHDLPIVALAKEKENALGNTLVDRVYLPGQKNPIPLKSHSASMFFLARLRDEAHRFSNRARERLGKKKRMRSALDDIAGIGPKTKQQLLTHLGSIKAIKAADDATLLAIPGVTARHVKALRAAYPKRPNGQGTTKAPAPRTAGPSRR
jgi:excinuclease ABC subunit C